MALGATQILLSYHAGPPPQHIAVDVVASMAQRLMPEMLALCTTEELLTLQRINARLSPEENATLLTPP